MCPAEPAGASGPFLEGAAVRRRIVSASAVLVGAFFAILGLGVSAASAATTDGSDAQPTLAQTGYDFTPMLVTAAVVLVIAGVTVILAKYALARSSHS